jgi:hypothetical protein
MASLIPSTLSTKISTTTTTTTTTPTAQSLGTLPLVICGMISYMLEPWDWANVKRVSTMFNRTLFGGHGMTAHMRYHEQRMAWWIDIVACSACDTTGIRRSMRLGDDAKQLCYWSNHLCSSHSIPFGVTTPIKMGTIIKRILLGRAWRFKLIPYELPFHEREQLNDVQLAHHYTQLNTPSLSSQARLCYDMSSSIRQKARMTKYYSGIILLWITDIHYPPPAGGARGFNVGVTSFITLPLDG